LRLTVRDGAGWLVETDPVKLASIVNAATRPRRPDYHIVPESELPKRYEGPHAFADGATTAPAAYSPAAVAAATTVTAASTVDLIVGYTPGFATANGGASGAMTRLNYLVDVTNAAYANSKVGARVTLVKAMQVSYTDTNSNDLALEQLSGYKSGTGPVTPNAAFNGLRSAREQYGADLVSLVRDFYEPEHGGCGIAFLLGGGLQGIGAGEGWDELAYSVVSDGIDQGTDGKTYFCHDETLAHELGHNMGAAHDKATAMGDDDRLDNPDDYGATTYSFGYKTGAAAGNFYTIMAYGDTGQAIYRIFSTPDSTYCGGHACGTSSEDNARTLRGTIPVVAGFRASMEVGAAGLGNHFSGDFNGDGKSDILWRNSSTGSNVIWRSGLKSTPQGVARVADTQWQVAAVGDFGGDGKSDILWRDAITGANTIWNSANKNSRQSVASMPDVLWQVAGIGDFNGDGKDDILWRHAATGANLIWRSGGNATPQAVASVTNLEWKVAGVGDFNADGKDDILWHDTATGANTIWKSADSSTRQVVSGVTNLEWQVVGVGDFNGDARSDILWRNEATGANTLWRSANSATRQVVASVALQWQAVGIGDFNGDARSDILWRNFTSGANSIWRSANKSSYQPAASVTDLAWIVVP
jgi:hypothetical protein